MTNSATKLGAYSRHNDIVDYILGITFEIWEDGGVDLISQYYAADSVVYSLDGITHGTAEVIEGTRKMLAAFPDRLLLGDDVITAGDGHSGYSSHRVLSPATNRGDSAFGPATGRPVRFMNMADCVIDDGIITLEWLARDNLALVQQLGLDPVESARSLLARRTDELADWFVTESDRVSAVERTSASFEAQDLQALATSVLTANWITGAPATVEAAYAPYAVLHRSPVEIISGRKSIADHYAVLRSAFDVVGASVDHVCAQSSQDNGLRVAVRWAVAASHRGDFCGIAPTGRPVFLFGVTHYRLVDGRIASEWTVFDTLAVMSQLL